jgi:hypothetical protein
MPTEDCSMKRKRPLEMPDVYHLPQPPAPPASPQAFVLCPIVLIPGQTLEQWLWQQGLYHWAFQQAQAVVRPSILERDLLNFLN